jgi:hypothetical protein
MTSAQEASWPKKVFYAIFLILSWHPTNSHITHVYTRSSNIDPLYLANDIATLCLTSSQSTRISRFSQTKWNNFIMKEYLLYAIKGVPMGSFTLGVIFFLLAKSIKVTDKCNIRLHNRSLSSWNYFILSAKGD